MPLRLGNRSYVAIHVSSHHAPFRYINFLRGSQQHVRALCQSFFADIPYAFHSLTLHPFLSLPFEAIVTPWISDDAGALGGTTEAAGGTNDDVAGGGGEDSAGWWWCRALTATPMFSDGEFFYVMNSEIGCVFIKSSMFPQDFSSSAADLGKPGDVPLIRCT